MTPVDADLGETIDEYDDAEPAPIVITCDACGGSGDSTGADWCEECLGTGRLDIVGAGIYPHDEDRPARPADAANGVA
ncbi:hypothetical protein [Nocardia pseudovaccinii]|uniref:hypothetical protein n=1 Tax=Nocardia pseudovaccinii TaxID=189540 RepID=UPI0012F4E9C6|nr:hypothetical protein [Nocardia pseudovaccinii]